MYYNTTNETGPLLMDFKSKAKCQDTEVLHLFRIYRNLTPSKAWQLLNRPDVPLTSIRRSITNLTAENRLFKTGRKMTGIYGRPENIWEIIKIY